MNKLISAICCVLTLTSCMSSYNVQGTSNVSTLDGKMLYMKTIKDGKLTDLDSCEIVHGQFHFNGNIDSAKMATIFMDDDNLLPIVVEKGDINVKLNDTEMDVSGTELNETLYKFLNRYNQLQNEQAELIRRHDQAIMNGSDMESVINQIQIDGQKLAIQEDSLVTNFVTENFDNVLGPGVFMLLTISQEYPMLTPWVEDIMSKATDRFKNDEYVKDFYAKAQENEQIMNGMRELQANQMQQEMAQPVAAPTPNELAQPVEE